MQQHEFLMLDPGPEFIGWSGQIGDTIVCMMTPRVLTDAPTRRVAANLVARQGGECSTCTNPKCPLRHPG